MHDYVAIEQKPLGHKAVSQTTNMEFILTANAKAHPSDGHAGLPTLNFNIKRWKRRARQVNQSSALSQVSRNAKRGRVETDNTQTIGVIGSEKRHKIMDAI